MSQSAISLLVNMKFVGFYVSIYVNHYRLLSSTNYVHVDLNIYLQICMSMHLFIYPEVCKFVIACLYNMATFIHRLRVS